LNCGQSSNDYQTRSYRIRSIEFKPAHAINNKDDIEKMFRQWQTCLKELSYFDKGDIHDKAYHAGPIVKFKKNMSVDPAPIVQVFTESYYFTIWDLCRKTLEGPHKANNKDAVEVTYLKEISFINRICLQPHG
jgi:hypothetical protein